MGHNTISHQSDIGWDMGTVPDWFGYLCFEVQETMMGYNELG